MKEKLGIIFSELFQISLATYLLYLIAENVKTGTISRVFDLNYLLVIVILSGLLQVFLGGAVIKAPAGDSKPVRKGLSLKDKLFLVCVTLAGAYLILGKTHVLGVISLGITLLAALLIFFVSYLILSDTSADS